MEKDQKAVKLLKKYSTWNRPNQKHKMTQEEIQYCIDKGVMFEPLTITHHEAIAEIKKLAGEVSLEEAAEAFLYSLSSGDNRYRTILSSVVWGNSLVEHEAMQKQSYRGCEICGLKLEEDGLRCHTDLNGYSKCRYYSGSFDICEAGFVLLDLREYRDLPKVKHCEEDIKILNCIFGLVNELTSANKMSALRKLISSEKLVKATQKEIDIILSVLSVCGVFDTPEHKSVATAFVPNFKRHFETEQDISYPLNYWRGKHGINFDAVNRIFGVIAEDKLNENSVVLSEVKREPEQKKRTSKAEAHFTEGVYGINLNNEDRYYYGLAKIENTWDKETFYSTTYQVHKRTEIYFEGTDVKKIIYEEWNGSPLLYQEMDADAQTENRKMLLPKTGRGKKKPLTPSVLMTSTYVNCSLSVRIGNVFNDISVYANNCRNSQELPLPSGRIQNADDFEVYTRKYIADLPAGYDQIIDRYKNKEYTTVQFHAGAIFRVQMTPRKYTYALILGKVRDLEKWEEIPQEHPYKHAMAQPIIYRQYDIVTENANMTVEELCKIPLKEANTAHDNEIHWERYPIIGYKELEESDIDFGCQLGKWANGARSKTVLTAAEIERLHTKKAVVMGLGVAWFDNEMFAELEEMENQMSSSYAANIFISVYDEVPAHIKRQQAIRHFVEEKLKLSHDNSMDEFAERYGGVTRKQYIELVKRRNL